MKKVKKANPADEEGITPLNHIPIYKTRYINKFKNENR